MNKRQRMTWAALDREAAAPPAIPGYGVEDQDHPAHTQDDPGSAPYMIGGPSEFAEDVHQPPYGDSGPPATPGYGVEDQDHPAHQGQVGRQASLMELVRRKSAKALVLAKATLGKKASWDAIEDQAFGFMSMDDKALDASIGRLGGDFLSMEEELMGMFPEEMVEEEGIVEDDMDDLDPGLMARMKAMEDELTAMRAAARRRADQNAPSGPTLGASGQSAEEEKRDEQAISNQNDKAASNPVLAMFDAFDTDRDGFVTAEDWTGPRAMFASMDTDRDGIIARHEVMAALPPEFLENAKKKKDEAKDKDDKGKEATKKADDDEDEDDEVAAAKKAYVAALRRAAKKAEGEDEETASDDEDEDDKGKEASKVAFGHMAEFDDDELEMLQAMQYGMDDDDDDDEGETACGDVMASDDSDEDDEDGSDKEAADHDEDDEDEEGGPSDDEDDEGGDKEASDAEFFQTGFDPMGLSDGTELTAADEAAFKTVFGSEDDDADDDDEGGDSDPEEDEDEGEKAGKKANQKLASLLKPQARKPSQGVQRVGTQSRTASAGRNEVNELSKLWASDPDVSGSFS